MPHAIPCAHESLGLCERVIGQVTSDAESKVENQAAGERGLTRIQASRFDRNRCELSSDMPSTTRLTCDSSVSLLR